MNNEWSIEEFVIDEGILADIALNEETEDKIDDLFNYKRDEKSPVYVVCSPIEDIHEINEVEQKQEIASG